MFNPIRAYKRYRLVTKIRELNELISKIRVESLLHEDGQQQIQRMLDTDGRLPAEMRELLNDFQRDLVSLVAGATSGAVEQIERHIREYEYQLAELDNG